MHKLYIQCPDAIGCMVTRRESGLEKNLCHLPRKFFRKND